MQSDEQSKYTNDSEFLDMDVCPWPCDPRELFPYTEGWFARKALYESKGLEDFGYKFLCEWFIHGITLDNFGILIEEAQKQLNPTQYREWLDEAWCQFDLAVRGHVHETTLSADSVAVLRVLDCAPSTLTASDLESMWMTADGKPNYRLSRKTIGLVLRSLRIIRYIEYPEGPRKGVSITSFGREYLRRRLRKEHESDTH